MNVIRSLESLDQSNCAYLLKLIDMAMNETDLCLKFDNIEKPDKPYVIRIVHIDSQKNKIVDVEQYSQCSCCQGKVYVQHKFLIHNNSCYVYYFRNLDNPDNTGKIFDPMAETINLTVIDLLRQSFMKDSANHFINELRKVNLIKG